RGLVGAVLAPHRRENPELHEVRLAAQDLEDARILLRGEVVLPDDFFGDHRAASAATADSNIRRPAALPSKASEQRSGCGIRPTTLPSRLATPAIERSAPFGFAASVGRPSASQ